LELIKLLVLEIRREIPRLGSGKLYYLLAEKFKTYGINMGRDALFHFLIKKRILPKQQ
jgi:hypothetical protein